MGLVGDIIGGITSLFGAKKNYDAQKKANETNLKIAQMNNEYNYRMFQEQMDYNTAMWNKQNAYNSAGAQRERLEDAGLNPYLMMSGGSAGTAGAANGVNPPSATPVQVQAPQLDLSTPAAFLQQAVDVASVQGQRDADARLKDRQAEQVGIENKYKAAELMAGIMERMESTRNLKHKAEYQRILNSLQLDTYNSDVLIKQRTAANLETLGQVQRAELALKGVQTAIAQKNLYWIDAQAQIQISEALSRIGLNRAQARSAVQGIIESQARTQGIRISNDVAKRTADTIVDRAYYETGISEGRSTQEQNKAKNNRHGEWAGNLGITKLLDSVFGY